ncbi:CCC motif membrane protein [Chryseobacterium sp. 09-1422]|uniref:CCC motif membrane protein n=1 Tax=Chryseobacterium kimseyorum TaxID=2984028 RepID=A0ABT3I1G3_9FLAO|nr:CCC motif membrane protein [Chryseobacterium kimseyorum]MCW3169915.1 CCC motif membrane protein [Chryseobacterium kimseyorum]
MDLSKSSGQGKSKLPYATAVLVLGISSIALCCCYGIPGIATGIIALILYRKDYAVYVKNKDGFNNFDSLKTGRTLSIIGIAMSATYIIYLIVVLNMYGMDALSNPKLLFENLSKK